MYCWVVAQRILWVIWASIFLAAFYMCLGYFLVYCSSPQIPLVNKVAAKYLTCVACLCLWSKRAIMSVTWWRITDNLLWLFSLFFFFQIWRSWQPSIAFTHLNAVTVEHHRIAQLHLLVHWTPYNAQQLSTPIIRFSSVFVDLHTDPDYLLNTVHFCCNWQTM